MTRDGSSERLGSQPQRLGRFSLRGWGKIHVTIITNIYLHGMVSVGRVYTTRSCEGWVQHLRPLILVVRTEGHKSDRSIWVQRAHTREAGAAHRGDCVLQPRPGTNLLGLSFPASLHTYQWLCNPLVISFSLLLHTRDFYTYFKGLYILTFT